MNMLPGKIQNTGYDTLSDVHIIHYHHLECCVTVPPTARSPVATNAHVNVITVFVVFAEAAWP